MPGNNLWSTKHLNQQEAGQFTAEEGETKLSGKEALKSSSILKSSIKAMHLPTRTLLMTASDSSH